MNKMSKLFPNNRLDIEQEQMQEVLSVQAARNRTA
jgi:hypothetical protein